MAVSNVNYFYLETNTGSLSGILAAEAMVSGRFEGYSDIILIDCCAQVIIERIGMIITVHRSVRKCLSLSLLLSHCMHLKRVTFQDWWYGPALYLI